MNKEDISALDRELFSELIESPINPLLFYITRPYVDSCDLKFRLQMIGDTSVYELVWQNSPLADPFRGG